MGWPQTATVIVVMTSLVGVQSFWIARSLEALRSEMHRGFDSLERRVARMEGEPPSLRRV